MRVCWVDGRKRAKSDHIDEYVQRLARPLLDQLGRIVLGPLCLFLVAEIAPEGLLAPGAVARVSDGREGGYGLVFAGVLKELSKMGKRQR